MSNASTSLVRRGVFAALAALVLLCGCEFVQPRHTALPPGPYRGILELEYNPVVPNPKGAPIPEKVNLEFDEVTEGVLPFTFDIVYETDTTFRMEIANGREIVTVPHYDIKWGRDQQAGRDTVRINFPIYDTHISAYYEENVVEGVWVVRYRDNYRIPFKAYFGKDHRFTALNREPAADLTGTWAVTFDAESEDAYPGVAEFSQNGNRIIGTFRTETGDCRCLEGTVQGPKLYLSVFDGSHAFLFEALLKDDGSLTGTFRSGRHYITDWVATRNDTASLPDPYELTVMREDIPLDFAFPNLDGDTVRLSDPEYAGRPKLITLFGTWCPNCRDEADFLKAYLARNDTKDLAVFGLAFEQYGPDDPRSYRALEIYSKRTGVPYPLLLAGSSDKAEASKALPMLNRVISYPTLLFVDRDNRVRRIHTGFNGPATTKYEEFAASFDRSISQLIARPDGTESK